MAKYNKINYPTEQIASWIAEGKTQKWIADKLKRTLDSRITAKLIYKVCKKHKIECQRTGPRSGEGNPQWKGGRHVNKNGYVEIWMPDHHSCIKKTKQRRAKKKGYVHPCMYVLEHRLKMEEKLGRPLLSSEVVHHVDGNKQNNHIDNLELFQNNAAHLAKTLSKRCPKWSESGKKKLAMVRRQRSEACRQRNNRLRAYIQKHLKLDGLPTRDRCYRFLKRHHITMRQAFEMLEKQNELPDFLFYGTTNKRETV